jgi:hypothetical protein
LCLFSTHLPNLVWPNLSVQSHLWQKYPMRQYLRPLKRSFLNLVKYCFMKSIPSKSRHLIARLLKSNCPKIEISEILLSETY